MLLSILISFFVFPSCKSFFFPVSIFTTCVILHELLALQLVLQSCTSDHSAWECRALSLASCSGRFVTLDCSNTEGITAFYCISYRVQCPLKLARLRKGKKEHSPCVTLSSWHSVELERSPSPLPLVQCSAREP